MSADRELLELAAKAAGIEGEYECWAGQGFKEGIRQVLNGAKCHRPWNALTDDGDALRLAAALKLHILHNDPGESALWVSAVLNKTRFHGSEEFQAEDGRAGAARRAIVRAAAEIGRQS